MNPRIKVRVDNISKTYQLYHKQTEKLLDILVPNNDGKNNRNFNALQNVSFEVYAGETIGVIGLNGSGKSTLSNILAEVIPPTSGELTINGETSLISITAGFNHQLTGVENIRLKCLMLGLKKQEIERIIPDIINFAEIGQFIHQPIKNYSSGMRSRLGFAISVFTNPDILIVDEALSVGDNTFYQKCMDKINEFKENGKTIFFISHSIQQMRAISDRVLWLHHGVLKEFGDANEVLGKYQKFIKWFNNLSNQEKQKYREEMLTEQQSSLSSVRKSRRFKKRNKSIKYLVQLIGLFLLTFFSALFMIFDKNPMAFYDEFNKKEHKDPPQVKSEIKPNGLVKTINRFGLLKNRVSDLYSDKEFNKTISSVEFGTPIFVLEQIGDLYRVEFNNQDGYINSQHVTVSENVSKTVDMKLNDLYSLFPESLETSYEFFFAFLGSDYKTLKGALNGLTDESEIGGKKQLVYGTYNVIYQFSDLNVAEIVTLKNIKTDDHLLHDLQKKANVVSNDEKLLLLNITDYTVVLDLENQEMAIRSVDSKKSLKSEFRNQKH